MGSYFLQYLVDVEVTAEGVECGVESLEEADDLHRCSRGANCCEAHQITEEHRHIIVTLSFDRFA